MKQNMAATFILIAVALLLLASVTIAWEEYQVDWWTIDGGGYALSTADGYVLGGSAGQPDAGLLTGETLTGETYVLSGGFWDGVPTMARYQIYLPALLSDSP